MPVLSNIKKQVRARYAGIAEKQTNCCCTDSSSGCSSLSVNYGNIDGYLPEADLALGCGIPTQFAGIKKGDTVVDLGSGAGNDAFVARALTGESGLVIGIDMTKEMIARANKNLDKLGYKNVEFRLGDIEKLPVKNESADVVISNCVLNLVPDKTKAFSGIYRILKPGGRLCISDIVASGEMSPAFRQSVELYAGCISGALEESEYEELIRNTGFRDIEVKIRKEVEIPQSLLTGNLSDEDIKDYKERHIGLFSITVVGYK